MLNESVGACADGMLAAQRAEERDVGIAVDGIEDQVRFGSSDGIDDGFKPLAAQRHVFLPDYLRLRALETVFDDRMRGPREYIVGADQEKSLLVQRRHGPLHGREDLLVGRRAHVDDAGRSLKTLELHGIDQEMVVLLEDRPHRLAACRSPAAEYRTYLLPGDEALRLAGESGLIRAAVRHRRLHGS